MSFETCYRKAEKFAKESGLRINPGVLRGWAAILERENALSLDRSDFQQRVSDLVSSYFSDQRARVKAEMLVNLDRKLALHKVMADTESSAGIVDRVRAALIGGSERGGAGYNVSARDISSRTAAKLESVWRHAVGDLRDVAESGRINKEIMIEKYALDNGLDTGKTGSPEALKIAQAMRTVDNFKVKLMKSINPWFDEISGWVQRNVHDQEKISKVSFDEWFKLSKPAYWDKSFPELNGQDKLNMFKSIKERIDQGVYGSLQDVIDANKFDDTLKTSPTQDLARRMTRARSFIPSDGEALFNYHEQFGQGDMWRSKMSDITQFSKTYGVMEKMGLDPYKNANDAFQLAKRGLFGEELQAANQADRDGIVRKLMSEVMSDTYAPARNVLSKTVHGLSIANRASKLAFAVFRSADDLARSASEVRNVDGRNIFQTGASVVSDFLSGAVSKENRIETANEIGLIARDVNLSLYEQMDRGGKVIGGLGAIADRWSKLNLIDLWHKSIRFAVGKGVLRQLGSFADLEHGSLNQWTKNLLSRFGMEAPEWNAIRQAVDVEGSTGNLPNSKYITPEAIMNLPDEAVIKYMHETGRSVGSNPSEDLIWKAKWDLSTKVGSMVNQMADIGSGSGSSLTAYRMFGGESVNTASGLARRLFTEFRRSAFAMYETQRRSYFSGQEAGRSGLSGVAQLAAFSGMMWAMQDAAVNLAKLKSLPDYTDPKKILEGVVGSQIGGLGAELIFNRGYAKNLGDATKNFIEAAAGPTARTLSELGGAANLGLNIGLDYLSQGYSNKKSPLPELGKTLVDLSPANGLAATYTLWNAYIGNGLKEFFGNQGYVMHLQNQVQSERGFRLPLSNDHPNRELLYNPSSTNLIK